MNKQKLAKDINKIAREIRLEQEEMFGRPHSKIWDERPSNRQDRRSTKQKLRNVNIDDDLDDLME